MEDGWTSRAKEGMTASLGCLPQIPNVLIPIQPVDSEQLHDVAISMGWESFILKSNGVVELGIGQEFQGFFLHSQI